MDLITEESFHWPVQLLVSVLVPVPELGLKRIIGLEPENRLLREANSSFSPLQTMTSSLGVPYCGL